MQRSYLITIDQSSLESLIFDCVDRAIKLNPVSVKIPPAPSSQQVDFVRMCQEYFPGVPESTVRQQTASLARTKIGKRVLFDRSDIMDFLRSKRQASSKELECAADESFYNTVANGHQRGRKVA